MTVTLTGKRLSELFRLPRQLTSYEVSAALPQVSFFVQHMEGMRFVYLGGAGSMPLAFKIGSMDRPARNLTAALAASASLACAATPALRTV